MKFSAQAFGRNNLFGKRVITNTILVVNDSLHAHTADNITLDFNVVLSVSSAAHAHAADDISLTTEVTLIVSDALHAHVSNNITLIDDSVVFVLPGCRVIVLRSVDRTIVITKESCIFRTD